MAESPGVTARVVRVDHVMGYSIRGDAGTRAEPNEQFCESRNPAEAFSKFPGADWVRFADTARIVMIQEGVDQKEEIVRTEQYNFSGRYYNGGALYTHEEAEKLFGNDKSAKRTYSMLDDGRRFAGIKMIRTVTGYFGLFQPDHDKIYDPENSD